MKHVSRTDALFAIAALLLVVCLQYATGVYRSDFGGHGDEAAHFVTSVMMRDFLLSGDYARPFAFARDYYLHYPRVAIGHWPPVMYLAGGLWFALFGVSRTAAMLFIAVTAAAVATLIYCIGRRLVSPLAAGLAAVLFLVSPLVLVASAAFMVEHLVTLLMLASAMMFARFARTGRLLDGLAFGVLAAVAILTRGSGWALGLVPVVTIVLTGKYDLLKRPGLWISAVPPLVTGLPWYYLTRSMQTDSWAGGPEGVPYWQAAMTDFSAALYQGLGLAIVILAVIGLFAKVVRPFPRGTVTPAWAALVGLAVGTFGLHCMISAGIEPRYMVTVIPPLVLLAAAGFDQSTSWLRGWFSSNASRVGLSVVVLAAFGAQVFALPRDMYNIGYGGMVADLDARLGGVPQVWLISTNTVGDGSAIAAAAVEFPRTDRSFVVRASKILVNQDWHGRDSKDLFPTPEKLRAVLDAIPIGLIMIDDTVRGTEIRPYHGRIKALVEAQGSGWVLTGSYPVQRGSVIVPNALHIYARRSVQDLRTLSPAIDYERLNALVVGNVVAARAR